MDGVDNPSGAGYPHKVPDNWGNASLATLAADTTAPAAVTGFTATPGTGQVSLTWTNPLTADWAGTQIRFKTTAIRPVRPTARRVYNGTGTSYHTHGLDRRRHLLLLRLRV